MSNADAWPGGEVKPVWYRVDLDQVAEAGRRLRAVDKLQRHVNERIEQLVEPGVGTLLHASIGWPIKITLSQLYNGHRRTRTRN